MRSSVVFVNESAESVAALDVLDGRRNGDVGRFLTFESPGGCLRGLAARSASSLAELGRARVVRLSSLARVPYRHATLAASLPATATVTHLGAAEPTARTTGTSVQSAAVKVSSGVAL